MSRGALRLLAFVLGLGFAVAAWSPAAWLASALERAGGGRVLLRETRGSWHDGSLQLLLASGGGETRPELVGGRLHWRIAMAGLLRLQLPVRLQWDGVSAQPLLLQLRPGWRGWTLQLQQPWQGQWSAQLLQGLGAPWNTVAPRGRLRLDLSPLQLQRHAGVLTLHGNATLDVDALASRLSPLPRLGSYRLQAQGVADGVALHLESLEGPLLAQGQGSWGRNGVHFSGSAHAAAGAAGVLQPLLALLGQRDGDRVLLRF